MFIRTLFITFFAFGVFLASGISSAYGLVDECAGLSVGDFQKIRIYCPHASESKASSNYPQSQKISQCSTELRVRCEEWESPSYDGPSAKTDMPGNNLLNSSVLASSPDSRLVFTIATSQGPDNYQDIATIAYRSNDGTIAWVTRERNETETLGIAQAIAVSPDGGAVYSVGKFMSSDGTTRKTFVAAYGSEDGRVLWKKYIEKSNPWAIAVNKVYPELYLSLSSNGGLILALDSNNGNTKWSTTYRGPENRGYIVPITVSENGKILYAGGTSTVDSDGYTTGWVAIAINIDTTPGTIIWAKTHQLLSMGNPPFGIKSTKFGSVILVGGYKDSCRVIIAFNSCPWGFLTKAYSSDEGTELWTDKFLEPNAFQAPSVFVPLALSKDNETAYVTGYRNVNILHNATLFNRGYVTAAYDVKTGNRKWDYYFGDPYHFFTNNWQSTIDVNPLTGEVYVAGMAGFDMYSLQAIDPSSGTLNWAGYYTSDAGGRVNNGVVARPDGRMVFSAGAVKGLSSGLDVKVIAYTVK